MNTTDIDWQKIGAALREPFNPNDVDFRPQGKPNAQGKAQAVCYIDARTVADRLDSVVGPGAWEFHYEPLVIEKGQVQVAKGILTIYGVTKEDIGEASNFDPSKGCVSDCLKRAAVLFGIGRYLYDVDGEWVAVDNYGRISRDDVQRMRGKLPRPDGKPNSQHTPVARPQPQQPAPTPKAAQQPTATPAATDSMALTYASKIDQQKLFGQLAARHLEANGGFLRNVTGREIDMDKLHEGHSDITLTELLQANEKLSRIPANGKAGVK